MATWAPSSVTAKAVVAAGFDFDPVGDIIYSRMDALQRKAGYCWNYDRAAPLFDMIIDCEPIYFKYGGAKWMIELWKGQYGIMTGAEIGVYKAPGTDFLKTAADYVMTGDKLSAIKNLGKNIGL